MECIVCITHMHTTALCYSTPICTTNVHSSIYMHIDAPSNTTTTTTQQNTTCLYTQPPGSHAFRSHPYPNKPERKPPQYRVNATRNHNQAV